MFTQQLIIVTLQIRKFVSLFEDTFELLRINFAFKRRFNCPCAFSPSKTTSIGDKNTKIYVQHAYIYPDTLTMFTVLQLTV